MVAFAILFFVYFLSSPDARFEADDAYDYAAAVERADYPDLLNPHHPIYLPLSKTLYTGVDAVFDVRGLDFMVALGSLFAASTVLLFYLALRQWFGAPTSAALFGAASLGASYIFWRYAGEAEIYAFAALAAVLLLWASVSWRPRLATLAGIGVLSVVAVLAHSVNAALIVALPLVLRKRGWEWKQLAVAGSTALVLLVVSTFAIYEWAQSSTYGPASETSFVGFYLGYGARSSASLGDIVPGVGVLGSVFVGSNSLFVLQPTRDYLARAFSGNSMTEEFVMGTTAPSWVGTVGLAAIALAALALVGFGWNLSTARIRPGSERVSLTPAVIWCLAYVAVVVLGGLIVQPEVWAIFPIPFWTLVTGMVTRRVVKPWILAVVPASLALATVLSGLLPLYAGENRLAEAGEWFVTEGRPGDLLLTADSAGLARYIAYESDAHAAQMGYHGIDERAVEMIEALRLILADGGPASDFVAYLKSSGSIAGYHEAAGGDGRLFVTPDMFDPPGWLVQVKPLAAAALIELGAQYGHLFETVDQSGQALGRSTDLGG